MKDREKTARELARMPLTVPSFVIKPAMVQDTMPELRHLLGEGRTVRTLLAAFVIRLRRQPVRAEMDALCSFDAGASPERILAEIDAMGKFPVASVADEEIRFPGE